MAYLTTSVIDKDTIITPSWAGRCEVAADALIEWYAQSNAFG